MPKTKPICNLLAYLGIFILLEFFSYIALSTPTLNQVAIIILAVSCLVISFYKLEYGLLMVLAELFIGSMGHLFILHLGNLQLSIRMILWAILLAVFFIKFIGQLIKNKQESLYLKTLKNFTPLKYFGLLALFVVISVINAYLRKHALGLIFSDANSWLYYLLLLPAIVIYTGENKKALANLKNLFIAASVFLSLKTLGLLFIFTHNLSFASDIYYWLRKTLVGEMTATLSGWPRIFIQGQIFSGVALFLVFWSRLKDKENKKSAKICNLTLAALFSSALLISFSRSFWIGLVCAIIFSLIIIWYFYSLRKALMSGAWLASSFILGFILIYLVAIFPYPTPGNFNADFISRISNGNESAISSRWSLLPVLGREIKKEPFFGQGYGATITYISSDPRVLMNNPDGQYTTYAFEWGYLDLWLKIGLFGLLSYLWLLIYLIKQALNKGDKNANLVALGLASSLVFLAVTNFFTPYLNHPLGMGIIIIGACLIQKDRVY
jgi:O-antigen ligase